LDRWLFTDHEDVKNRSYWLQVIMIGDPAWRWRAVIADEMLDHVVVPVLSIVPALALAMWLTTRFALRPLERIARQAAALGAAVGTGGKLAALATANLPLEFYQVVQAINAMLARLEHTLSLQKQFAADAAHELCTPLAVLLLQIDDMPPGPAFDTMRDGLRGLGTLVNQLLQFAQTEDAVAAHREPLDVGAIARKACEELAAAALTRGQELEFDAPDNLMPLLGHPTLIETAIRNVVENAIKFAPAGTAITVNVDPASRVTVEDRGPGVPDEQKELIFNRFWRADRRHSKGAGIGLALVRRIAQLHGGDVRIEDREGGGARFVLSLFRTCILSVKQNHHAPAHRPATSASRAARATAHQSCSGRRANIRMTFTGVSLRTRHPVGESADDDLGSAVRVHQRPARWRMRRAALVPSVAGVRSPRVAHNLQHPRCGR
jgi:signal transduction histidine kinase